MCMTLALTSLGSEKRTAWALSIFGIGGKYMHTCRHVESAAPRPVPVHTRIPRLYSVEVFDTPANYKTRKVTGRLSESKV